MDWKKCGEKNLSRYCTKRREQLQMGQRTPGCRQTTPSQKHYSTDHQLWGQNLPEDLGQMKLVVVELPLNNCVLIKF